MLKESIVANCSFTEKTATMSGFSFGAPAQGQKPLFGGLSGAAQTAPPSNTVAPSMFSSPPMAAPAATGKSNFS
jgi:hypothetical protein